MVQLKMMVCGIGCYIVTSSLMRIMNNLLMTKVIHEITASDLSQQYVDFILKMGSSVGKGIGVLLILSISKYHFTYFSPIFFFNTSSKMEMAWVKEF